MRNRLNYHIYFELFGSLILRRSEDEMGEWHERNSVYGIVLKQDVCVYERQCRMSLFESGHISLFWAARHFTWYLPTSIIGLIFKISYLTSRTAIIQHNLSVCCQTCDRSDRSAMQIIHMLDNYRYMFIVWNHFLLQLWYDNGCDRYTWLHQPNEFGVWLLEYLGLTFLFFFLFVCFR